MSYSGRQRVRDGAQDVGAQDPPFPMAMQSQANMGPLQAMVRHLGLSPDPNGLVFPPYVHGSETANRVEFTRLRFPNGLECVRFVFEGPVDGNGQAVATGGEEQGSGLLKIWASNGFQPAETVKGLDFGKQVAQRAYPLHCKEYKEHGLVTYSQSARGRLIQNVYHVATLGVGTSGKKCVIVVCNNREDVDEVVVGRPDTVPMGAFGSEVLRKMPTYEFARSKMSKGPYTFYVYYVKKKGSEVLRPSSWANVITSLANMSDPTDWAGIVSGAAGRILSSVISAI